jgi:predicted ATPase/DNA-binding SARP family transcriptional activator
MGDGLRVGLLGPTVVEVDGRTAAVPGAPQRAVLARLALSAGRTVPDADLVDVLWPGGGPDNALGNLQSYVSRLRRVVGTEVVARDTIGYRLAVAPDAVDAGRFDALIGRAEAAADAPASVALFAEALDLWRGEPFCDLADALALAPDRARLAALHRRAVEGWLAARSAAGEGAALLPDLERAAAEDPTGEAVHLLLMAVLHQVGRSPDALRVGAALRERIVDATGLDPSSAVGEMERRILADDPALRPEAPAARPRTARRGPRLAPADRFVGRVAELEALGAALAGHRIVSVVGPGGAGKTRLVQEVIDRGGLTPVVVDLAPVEDEGDVLARAAAALGVQGSTEDLDAALVDVVGGRAVTLVLHSCEHVLDAARSLAERFLGAGPDVAVLATSRLRLGLAGEKVIRLAGLGPDEQVELFRDRAALLRDDFVVTPEVEALVRSIGRQLDGLPLALELAAGREAVFGLAQLDAQLAVALDVVEPAGPAAKSVTSAVEWSYGLLSEPARDLFDRLAVAPGGVTLEALEHLSPAGVGPATAALGELVEASLVDVDLGADPPRYRALEVVRRVGLDHLDAETRADARRRLRAWMLAHVEQTAHLRMARSALSTVLFRRELANLAAALVVDGPDDRRGLGPLAVEASTLVYDDPQVEILERLRVLDPGPGPLDEDQALCSLAAGVAAWIGGETEPAERLLDAALAVLPPGHPRRWSATFAAMPNAMFTGDVDAVEAMARELRDDPTVPDWAMAVGVGCAALMRLYTGDRPAAEAWIEREADLFARAAASDGFVAFTHAEMAAEVDPEAAVERYARAARLSDALGTTYTREIAWLGRAAVLVRQGRTAEAAAAVRDVVRSTARIGMWPQVWTILRITAELLVAEGHPGLALTVLTAADHDPKASAVMGPDVERLAALADAAAAALRPAGAAAARSRGRTATRAELVDDVVTALATLT